MRPGPLTSVVRERTTLFLPSRFLLRAVPQQVVARSVAVCVCGPSLAYSLPPSVLPSLPPSIDDAAAASRFMLAWNQLVVRGGRRRRWGKQRTLVHPHSTDRSSSSSERPSERRERLSGKRATATKTTKKEEFSSFACSINCR